MAQEFDRRIMPDIFHTTLTLSLGAAWKSVEMLRHPAESLPRMVTEMKSLVTMPDVAGDGLRQKMEAMAGVWVEKGMGIMAECKTAGEKFTEGA
jgi:hypothetical protein